MGDISAKNECRSKFKMDSNKSVDFAANNLLSSFHRDGYSLVQSKPFEMSKMIDARLTAMGDAFRQQDKTKKQIFYKMPKDPEARAQEIDDCIEDDQEAKKAQKKSQELAIRDFQFKQVAEK